MLQPTLDILTKSGVVEVSWKGSVPHYMVLARGRPTEVIRGINFAKAKPVKGLVAVPKPATPTKKDLTDLIKANRSWFQVERFTSVGASIESRKHGDTGEEEPGEEDIREAHRLAKILKKAYPEVSIDVDSLDEWTTIQLSWSKKG